VAATSGYISPIVLTELACMLLARSGPERERTLLDEVSRGAYCLQSFSVEDVAEARAVFERYADFGWA
jgi:uncharacterized protein with PIN domain